jgi:urea carboxylase
MSLTTPPARYREHTLLIPNRGEIALRIIRTAKKLGLRTISIYTPADANSPHVTLADTAVALPLPPGDCATEGACYLNQAAILEICKSHNVTLVHPGYGFLSENAEFAETVEKAGMGWLGPRGETIKLMGLKHLARDIVKSVGLEVAPGSDGLVKENIEEVVSKIGLPVIFKASAGGGGLGMVVCEKMEDVGSAFEGARSRAKVRYMH